MDIRAWIRGNGPKSMYIKSIGGVFGIMLGGLLAAMFLYVPPFSVLWVEVSDLAVTTDNPVGGVIFAACFLVAGLLLAPHGVYFYKILRSDIKIAAGASGACLFASGIGFSIVNLFPYDVNSAMHLAGAFVAIGGLALGSWVSLLPVVKKMARNASWPAPWHVLGVYGQLFVVEVVEIVCGRDRGRHLRIRRGPAALAALRVGVFVVRRLVGGGNDDHRVTSKRKQSTKSEVSKNLFAPTRHNPRGRVRSNNHEISDRIYFFRAI